MSERTVIVIEYDADLSTQQALNDAMEQITKGADRLDPDHIKVMRIHIGTEDYADRVLAVFDKDASAPSKAPSSHTETTDGSVRPIPPEALNGLTGGFYDAERAAERARENGISEADARFQRYRVALREVILDVIDGENSTEDDCADEVAKEAMSLADADHAALTAEVERLKADGATRMYSTVYERSAWQHDIGEHKGSDLPYGFCPRCELEHPKGVLAERDATIEAKQTTIEVLRAQLNEATNVPDADDADECAHTALSLIYRRERDDALATIEELQQLGNLLSRKADLFSADLAERDATVERVKDVVRAERHDLDARPGHRSWDRAYQQGRRDMTRVVRAAIEATNVPDHDDPPGAGVCLNSCDGQFAAWSTPDHLWRCTKCGRIVGAKP